MSKRYALYLGCLASTEQYGYELSVREVLSFFNIELVYLDGFSCCGEPMKNINQLLTLYLSARNIAVADKNNLDICAPCAMCHLSLSETAHILRGNNDMRNRVNGILSSEGLEYHGSHKIVHTIDVLYEDVGLDVLKKSVRNHLKGLKVSAHYGCHLIRPSEIGRPDNSENPKRIESILEATGAEIVYYPERLDCCGAPLLSTHYESALTKTGQKLQSLHELGVDLLVDVCPWCHKMFDEKQSKSRETVSGGFDLPVLYLTQLVGLALGLDPDKLGLNLSQSSVERILSRVK
ncbi:MAG: CoB--CoM heterodisulfide reductase iron-sulfur subunit B family protein [Candidatus Thermoplasmatota archaeon]